MKKSRGLYDSINFPDQNFKILSVPGRISSINSIDDFSKIFHEEIEIKLFYEGSSTLLIGDETVVTQPGDVVMINPYEFHSTVDIGEINGKYHIIMISLDFFDSENSFDIDLRELFIKERIALKTLIRGDERIVSILNRIVKEFEQKEPMYHIAVTGMLMELIAVALRKYKREKPLDILTDKNIRYYEIIYPAIRKIRKDYASKITVEGLADLCNISKCHFCRIFKAVTGETALTYQTKYRLKIADVMLKNTNESISEIATLCGFDDVCYFSRCYKKHNGISPRQKRAILSK